MRHTRLASRLPPPAITAFDNTAKITMRVVDVISQEKSRKELFDATHATEAPSRRRLIADVKCAR